VLEYPRQQGLGNKIRQKLGLRVEPHFPAFFGQSENPKPVSDILCQQLSLALGSASLRFKFFLARSCLAPSERTHREALVGGACARRPRARRPPSTTPARRPGTRTVYETFARAARSRRSSEAPGLGGGGLLGAGAARVLDAEANFSARFGLEDLAKWLGARPGKSLRKRNVSANGMQGATLVCRRHSSRGNREAAVLATTAARGHLSKGADATTETPYAAAPGAGAAAEAFAVRVPAMAPGRLLVSVSPRRRRTRRRRSQGNNRRRRWRLHTRRTTIAAATPPL
jgi:hypothetical protein